MIRRFLPALALSLAAASSAGAQECRPVRTALVLSGGGVKGLAHIGVLEVLDSLQIRPDLIVGTSMGAIIGGLYAAGYSAREIDSLTRALPISEIVRPFRPPAPHPWDHRLPMLFLVKGRNGFEFQTGIVDETQPNAHLNVAMLRGNLLARGQFDRLPIPFLAVATDLRDRRTVVLGSGDLAQAVRASSAIPLVFPPVLAGEAVLVDGGLSANIPVAQARAAGAERVIVSDVTEHPDPTLDVESPLALADQLLGFLFQQAPPPAMPGDVMVRPGVQGFRSLDFSPARVAAIRRLGRLAADSTIGRAQCLPRGPRAAAPPGPTVLGGWTIPGAPRADSVLVARMLRLTPGGTLDRAALADRLLGLAEAEALRGVWLNPAGGPDTVTFRVEPIRTPNAVGGAGVAYDHDQGGRFWGGLFYRRVFGTTMEASGLATVGRSEREVYGSALWHFDGGWSRLTPSIGLRVRSEDVRLFAPDGFELEPLATKDARLAATLEWRARDWRVRAGAEAVAWGADFVRGRTEVGPALRLERLGATGPEVRVDASANRAFRSVQAVVSWPSAARRWTLLPVARVGMGTDLPPQWTFGLGGDDGFPGLHMAERRGTRNVDGSLRIGYVLRGPLQARLLLAAGRAWTPGPAATGWLAGARLGIGADTPVGPIDLGYGASGDRRAFYLRMGRWF